MSGASRLGTFKPTRNISPGKAAGKWLSSQLAVLSILGGILGGLRYAPSAIPWLVGLTITAAYWFTASTSFANPAVTLARGFTTTFAGIAIKHVPGFVHAQMVGAGLGAAISLALFPPRRQQLAAGVRTVQKATETS